MFLVPALAGYIAYAIADRPGIAPGFVMGGLGQSGPSGSFGTPQTGFLGGIIGGVLAGVIAHWIAGWKVPAWARGLMPVLVIPLLTTLIAGFLMIVVLGKPIALADGPAQRRPQRMSGGQRGPARRHPRPDDGLRHGRPAQQGRLQLRRRRPRRAPPPRPATPRS